MNLLNAIPIEIWSSITVILTAIYSAPSFLQSRKREILTYKLLNVYTPLKKAVSHFLNKCSNVNDLKPDVLVKELKQLIFSIVDVIDKEYAYCPEELIRYVDNLKNPTIDNQLFIFSLQKIIYIIYDEEFYCQRKLKFNTQYASSFYEYPMFARLFKKFMKYANPIITLLLIINSILSVLNIFIKIVPQVIILSSSLILISLNITDYLLSKKILHKKLNNIEQTASNQNSPK